MVAPGPSRLLALPCDRHAIPDGDGRKREVRLARMTFDSENRIQPMDTTARAFRAGRRGEPIIHGRGLPDALTARPRAARQPTVNPLRFPT